MRPHSFQYPKPAKHGGLLFVFSPHVLIALVLIAEMTAGPVLAAQVTTSHKKEDTATPVATFDELIYNNGDRLRGHLVTMEGDVWVFLSEQFGSIRVSTTVARVQLADSSRNSGSAVTPDAPAQLSTPRAGSAKTSAIKAPGKRAAVGYVSDADSGPAWLVGVLREFIGEWHGKLSLSAELATDAATRHTYSADSRLTRKWSRDELQFHARYDYSKTNDVTNTDMMKLDALWHHDLSQSLFSVYRPTFEWNKAFTDPKGIPIDYVLLQTEVGLGVFLLKRTEGHLSAGVSDNLFDVWILSQNNQHTSRSVQSVFAEAEWKLPWKLSVINRGVYYHALSSAHTGWENKLAIEKKLTDELCIGVRHEVRHNNPDIRISDYNLMQCYLGLEY